MVRSLSKYAVAAVGAMAVFLVLAGSASAYTVTSFNADVFRSAPGAAQSVIADNAGEHPNRGVTAFTFSQPASGTDFPQEIRVDLPAGLESSPDDFPRCADVTACDPATQVGVQDVTALTGNPMAPTARFEVPIYNMELQGANEGSRFQFRLPTGTVGTIIGSIRDTGDFGQFFTTEASSPLLAVRQTFFGTPGSTEYNTGAPPGQGMAGTAAIGRGQSR